MEALGSTGEPKAGRSPDDRCAPPSDTLDRRSFLLWLATASVATTGAFSLATMTQIITPPNRSIEGKTTMGPTVIGSVSGLETGSPRIVEWGDDFVFLVKLDAAKVVGLNAACPHVRCKLHFNEANKQFDCPCHGSYFALDGKRLGGPAPRDMIAALLTTDGDKITITGFES